jgi:type I restriction enzyme S subunit
MVCLFEDGFFDFGSTEQTKITTMEVKVGYKYTETGIIPQDWDVKELGEIVNFSNGKGHEQFIDEIGEYVVVNSKFISTDGKIKKFSRQNLSPLFIDDITIVMSDIPNGKALAKCYLIEKNNKYTLNQRIGSICPKDGDSKYFYYQLNRNKYFLAYDSGTGQTNLKRKEVLDCPFILPPTKSEQTAIATALSDTDALISSLEKLIAKKRNIKQGAMQKLLQPKDGWEVRTLGELLKSVQLGGNYANSETFTNFPLIKMGNIQRGYISTNKLEYIINSCRPEERDRLKYGDVIFNTRNTLDLVGKVSVWRNELPEAYFNSNIMRLNFNSEFISSNFFMNYLLNTEFFISKLKDVATGTTSVAAIYTRDLLKIKIAIPKPNEQIFIANILTDMDIEISALQYKLEKYKNVKLGMMQTLLTGKIRLV